MKDGIDIGEFIYGELVGDEAIHKIVGKSIYPLMVKKDIKYPFLVYKRTSLAPAYTKDRVVQDNITLQIDCVSDAYSESVKLASLVRQRLDWLMRNGELFIKLEDVKEEAANYTFTQSLTFAIKINY